MRRSVLLGLSVFGLMVSLMTLVAQVTLLLHPAPGAGLTAKASSTGIASFCINAVPVLNITCNSTMSQNTTYFCLLNATDMQGDNITFSSNSTFFNITNGTINFTPTNADVGNHSVMFFAADSSGCPVNESNTTIQFSVENINGPPFLVQNLPDTPFPANTTVAAFFLNDYFTDPDGDPLNYTSTIPTQFSLTILPSSQVRISGNICDATELVIFTATDPYNASASSNTVTLRITCTPPSSGGAGGGQTGGGGGGGGGAVCLPKWECDEWFACLPSNLQWRYCYDTVGCEGPEYLKRSCEYEGPPPACQENWLCSEWGQCRLNNTQTRSCEDLNGCGTSATQPPLTQGCMYIATCNDGLHNGDETGVDCGGGCASCALVESPLPIEGVATWLLILIILSILVVSGVAHYYRAQIAQVIATIGFMLRHRAYKDILLDAATRKAYFERLIAFEQLLSIGAQKPAAVYNTLATLVRQYYVDAIGVHSEAIPEEIEAKCKELRLRHETTGMLIAFFNKLNIIEQEDLELDEFFIQATVEELRTIVCLTSDYTTEELNRQVDEVQITEAMSFFDEIFARSINAMRAVQFHQLDTAKKEYMTMLTRYDPLSEEEKEQIYPELQWIFNTMKFQSEITGARVVHKT